MPAAGTPVASTITSISGKAMTASASCVTCVRERLSQRGRANRFVVPPGRAQLAPRALDIEIGDREDAHPAREPRLRQKHGAELARADEADGHWTAGGLPLQQQGVEIHRTLRLHKRSVIIVAGSIVDRHPRPAAGMHVLFCAMTAQRNQRLLAQRARDEGLGLAFGVVRRAAPEQDLRRALLLRLGVEALAGAKPFATAGC